MSIHFNIEKGTIKSFICKCIVKEQDVYILEPSPQMCQFFGTTEASYKKGILARIRRDIGADSADALGNVLFDKAAKGEDFRIVYPSRRADGSHCDMQLDAYAGALTEEGRIYTIIEMDITELIQARNETAKLTAENNSLLETIYHLPSISVLYTIDENGYIRCLSFSDEFCRMVGCSQGDIWQVYTEDAMFAVHPEDKQRVYDHVRANLHNKRPSHIAYRIRLKGGSYKWVSINFMAFMAGDRQYIYVVYTDIDDIKQQEQELALQYEAAQSFIDSLASDTQVATMRLNLTQDRIEVIHNLHAFLPSDTSRPYSRELQALMEMLPRRQDREKVGRILSREHLLASYGRGTTVISIDYLFKPPASPVAWVRSVMHLSRRPGGSDIIAFNARRDVSREKMIDIILNDVVIKQYDFISVIDAGSNSIDLISVNHQSSLIEEVHGGADYEGIMQTYVKHRVVPEEQQACIEFMTLCNVRAALEHSEVCTSSFTVEENGQLRNKRLDYSYIDRESGLLTLIRTDFTEMQKKQLDQEERLRGALQSARQASLAKSEFLSRMSHEIRTPMNAIIGLGTLALRERGLTPALEDHLKKIGISARFLLTLINDILDMSRIESGKMLLKSEEFNFHRMIDNINAIVYPQCQERGIDYECVLNGFVEETYVGDEMKLQQVLLNMLGNAIKFTERGGKIHFMIEELSHDQANGRLRFTIADTGQGIDPAFLPHIFDAFSQEDGSRTTVYGGTGLGLAISKNIVHLMDGTIDVHSVKGIGSDFTIEVSLGLSDHTLRWNMMMPPVSAAPLQTLIVDDDVIVCQHTELVLSQAGFDAEWVGSGGAAVERVQLRHDAGRDYDLVLVDWKMPDMDGVETARRIRSLVGPDVTIIILTAYDWNEIEEQARAAGVDKFIRKPVFVSSVLQAYHDKTLSVQVAEPPQDSYDFTGFKLLLAEDNLINAEIARRLLEMTGFQVDVASNGVEAIKAFTDSQDGEYSAILMDIRMPLMDGLEAAKIIRSIHKKDALTIPIIAMSANAFEEDVRKSLASGMNEHLTKPIEADHLYATLRRFLKKDESL